MHHGYIVNNLDVTEMKARKGVCAVHEATISAHILPGFLLVDSCSICLQIMPMPVCSVVPVSLPFGSRGTSFSQVNPICLLQVARYSSGPRHSRRRPWAPWH